MGNRRDPGFGLLVLDDRLTTDTLAPKGAGTRDSAYTEQGPQPGQPIPEDPASRWRPQAQGAQSVALSMRTARGGYPGRGAGAASVLVRLATESAAADWRSWNEPNLLEDWTTPSDAWGSSSTWDEVTATVLPDSHRVIVVARSGTDGGQTWQYDPRTELWTSLYDFTTNPGLAKPICVVCDEEAGNRLILFAGDGSSGGARQQIAYYSDDGGTSWEIYSRGMYDNTIADAGGPLRIATARGLDWLGIMPVATPGHVQYASSDRGVSWQRVSATVLSGSLHFPIRASSTWIVAYARAADSFLCIKVLGSARSPFADAAEQLVYSFAIQNVVGCRDYDGALYLYATTTGGNTACLVSYDEGTTWTEYESSAGGREYVVASAGVQPTWRSCVPAAGSICVVGPHESATTWHLCRLGGWSNVEQATRSEAGSLKLGPVRFGIAGAGTGIDYIALEFPDTYGQWTRLGSAGTRTMSGSDIGFQVSCTQAQVERYQSATLTSPSWCSGGFCVRVSAGNNRGGTAPTTNAGLIWEIVLDNGSASYLAYIEIAADGIRTHDGGTQRSDAALTMSTWTHIRYYMRPGGLTVWYRQEGTHKWTRIANDVTITGAAPLGLGTYAIWGHVAAAAAGTTTWHTRYAHHQLEAAWRHQLDTIASSDDAYTAGVLGLAYGRRLPGRGAAYPCPELTSTSEAVGYLTATGGPTYTYEDVELPVAYTYGVDRVHPTEAPSPRKGWRASDTSEVKLVWDMGAAKWHGGAIGLLVLSAQPAQFVLERDDGGAGWTTLATLDKTLGSGLTYTFTETTMIPAAGTTSIARYIREGELVGGYVILEKTGPTTVARRIVRNSGGFWADNATVQRVRIEVDGVDGSEFGSGTTGQIIAPHGLIVAYPSVDTARRYLRVRIASGAVVPDARYEAGLIAVGRVVATSDPSWAWSSELQLSRRARRNAEGALEVAKLGPPRRLIEYGWPDGAFLQDLRQLADSPDYFADASGPGAPIGTRHDQAITPLAIIEHQMQSGVVPAAVIPRLPAANVTLNDPSLFLYGRLLTERVGLQNIVGTEGVSEVLRVDSLAFEEIR